MIAPERFYDHLSTQGIHFFAGVPDSLMKDLLMYLQKQVPSHQHVITANEGLAVALATGYHFRTGEIPLVYLQNSGLGNAINPLTSLTDPHIYGVPMLLLIGWRGMPGQHDEPQHTQMGRITEKLLDVLEIPSFILDPQEAACFHTIDKAIAIAKEKKQPVALLVTNHLFEDRARAATGTVEGVGARQSTYTLSREQVLEKLYEHFTGDETVVCTTGKTGREFYELNTKNGRRIQKEFLCVGAMGLANHVALGIDLQQSSRVVMLDGDGAALMHLGSLTTIGNLAKASFVHILINNGCHESVGGQPTAAFDIDLCAIAKAAGYEKTFCITNEEELTTWLQNEYNNADRKQFVEIRVNASSRDNLSRPQGLPGAWKDQFMQALKNK